MNDTQPAAAEQDDIDQVGGTEQSPAAGASPAPVAGPLDPDEIERREFLVSLRGYDRDEVHEFLATIAAGVRDLLGSGGGDRPRTAAEIGDDFTRLGQEVASLLRAAQESADRIVAEARTEADDLRGFAERDREAILTAASKLSSTVRTELASLVRDVEREVTSRLQAVDGRLTALLDGKDATGAIDLRDAERPEGDGPELIHESVGSAHQRQEGDDERS